MKQLFLGHSTAEEFHRVKLSLAAFLYPVPQAGGIGERRIKTSHELSGPESIIMAAH